MEAADPAALVALARRLGYGGADEHAVAALRGDQLRHATRIREIYERHVADATRQ